MGAGHLVERGGSLIHTPPRSCSYVEALLLTSPPPPQHINNHRRRPPARPRGRLHEHGVPLHRRHVVLRLHGQLLRAGRLEQRRSDRHRQVPDVVVPRQQPRRPGADVPLEQELPRARHRRGQVQRDVRADQQRVLERRRRQVPRARALRQQQLHDVGGRRVLHARLELQLQGLHVALLLRQGGGRAQPEGRRRADRVRARRLQEGRAAVFNHHSQPSVRVLEPQHTKPLPEGGHVHQRQLRR